MNTIVIHNIPGSPYGRSVLVALEEKGQRYRVAPVAPGTLRKPEHLARHPFGRVPVMDHGDFRLYECQAMLRYIDRAFPQPPLSPADPRAAARMDMLMNITDWYLFQGVASVIAFQRVVGPRLMGITPDEAAIGAAMPKAHVVFAELSKLLGDDDFFAGGALSLADVLLAPQLDFLEQTPEWTPLTAGADNIRRWLARMNARPSMAKTTWGLVAEMAAAG